MDALVLLRELAENNLALKKVADMIAEQYVKLPVDADGVPIRPGDTLEWAVGTFEEPSDTAFEVEYLAIDRDGYFDVMSPDERDYPPEFFRELTFLRHHKPPTVEDVLREFSCVLMGKREFDGDVAEAISEYAARLRLAGDDE